ncbi:hypothetical protein [Streptomyces sp. 2A115]|uniref:hypothetical protein n=1 Tax=Streptomyces sp. 2A115 TaxID=3457439 RepID=UPI003FD0F815
MAVHEPPHRSSGFHLPSFRRNLAGSATGPYTSMSVATASVRDYAFASLRLLSGFVVLSAFLDKTVGFGYATQSGNGWIDGVSPTEGFLRGVAAGPMESTFHSWAGHAWADWLFMLGLLGIGLALIGGFALRLAAVAGTAMMALMWIAEWPPAQHLPDGVASMSTNSFADRHLLYAVLLITLAAVSAGDTLGIGRHWARLPIVRDNRWLR